MCSEIFKSLNSIKSYKSILAISSHSGLSDKEKKLLKQSIQRLENFGLVGAF